MRKNDRLYNKIKGGLYHSTSVPGYRMILESKAILPNTGSFPFSHDQSQYSPCYQIGAISLLDLRDPKYPLVGRGAWTNWTRFLTHHKPITVLLQIDPSCLSEPLHDYESLQIKDSFTESFNSLSIF